MKEKRVSFIFPFAAYIGTVLGVGLYSLPYVMSQSGVWVFLFFLILVGFLVYMVNMMFADVVIKTPTKERFLGYIGQYVGKKTEKVFAWVTIAGFWGTFLVYLLVWGQFAHTVFGSMFSLSPIQYSLILFFLTFVIIFKGGRTVETVDIIMLTVVVVLFIILFILGAQEFEYVITVPENTLGYILPYGTIMFAMWGAGVIPEVVNQLRDQPEKARKLIRFGKIIPLSIALIFSLIVVGVSGTFTSKEAFEGLRNFMSPTASIIGSLIGMITIALAYNNLGWVSKSMLMKDLGFSRVKALSIILLPPLVLMGIGVHDFVVVMSISGAVFLALQGLMIFQLYQKARNGSSDSSVHILKRRIPKQLISLGVILFIIGVIIEIGLVVYEQCMT